MSGGSYDYFTFKLEEFAAELRRRARSDLPDEVRAARLRFAAHMEQAAQAAYAVEWVDSGDWGSGDELDALGTYFQGFTPGMAADTLRELAGRVRSLSDALEMEAARTSPSNNGDSTPPQAGSTGKEGK